MADVSLSEAQFFAEVEGLLARASERGIPLRVCGSVGLYYHVRGDPLARALYCRRRGHGDEEPRFKDLDLASLEKKSSDIYKLFVRELGYREDRETNSLFGMYRNIYFHPHFDIDIFYDTLRFSHNIPIKERLLPGRTLAPEDLFLAKAQIHKPSQRDLVDLAAFACALPIEALDRAYLADLLGNDWGLWYDANRNLQNSREILPQLLANETAGLEAAVARASERLRRYLVFFSNLPKTRRWTKRASKGTAIPWYAEVEEIR